MFKKVLLAVFMLTAVNPLVAQAGSLYVPLNPCRMFDSRVDGGAALAGGSTTYLLARGSCGVPEEAVAVAVTAVAFSPSASGHLKLWESSLPQPVASSMNFRSGPGSDSSFLAPRLCYPVAECAAEDLALYVSQTTHVILDVVGYYIPAY